MTTVVAEGEAHSPGFRSSLSFLLFPHSKKQKVGWLMLPGFQVINSVSSKMGGGVGARVKLLVGGRNL